MPIDQKRASRSAYLVGVIAFTVFRYQELPIFRPYGTKKGGWVRFLPTSRPYGTGAITHTCVFYPYFVPTGLGCADSPVPAVLTDSVPFLARDVNTVLLPRTN